jgi:hypothetical protein
MIDDSPEDIGRSCICPDCNGCGVIVGITCDDVVRLTPISYQCPTCNGTGEVRKLSSPKIWVD